ncbi:MAG TPA: GlxA family transcriptional regulator [Paracoccaceae bacterium]|nr:GlxA family transcriptional regulator [Paracoccaceae bacterium]
MTFAAPLSAARSRVVKAVRAIRPADQSRHFVFLLLDQFTQLAFSCAIEPLRLANHVAGRTLYSWTTCSLGGMPVRASNGIAVLVDGDLGALGPRDTLVVVGGQTPRGALDPHLLSWLRRQMAHGVPLIGICAATSALAQAGLIRNQRCAVHWELCDAFAELHPDVEVVQGTFTLDGVATTAGGTASADLMLHLIGQEHGSDLASRVADQMIYSGIRGPLAPQTSSLQARYGLRNPLLFAALRLMEANLADPLTLTELAERAGASVRQFERLFQRHLNTSPRQHYLELRLNRAQKLLSQTDMPITTIALACGFASPSHFSKKYRAHFGHSAQSHRLVNTAEAA